MQTGAVGASCVWWSAEHGLRCTRLNHAVAANHPKMGEMGLRTRKTEVGGKLEYFRSGSWGSCLFLSRGKEIPAAPSALRVRGDAEE